VCNGFLGCYRGAAEVGQVFVDVVETVTNAVEIVTYLSGEQVKLLLALEDGLDAVDGGVCTLLEDGFGVRSGLLAEIELDVAADGRRADGIGLGG
jgi:hypothetical protein